MTKKPKYSKQEIEGKELHFHYWGAMNYFVGLIRSSELKAGLILSFYGIIFNFLYQNIENIKTNFEGFGLQHILAIIWLIATVISMYQSVRSFIPRIEKNYDKNLFFFGDIISKFGDINQYAETLLETSLDKEKMYDQLGQQIYINAKITAAKFKNVNSSIKYLVISLITLITLIIFHILKAIF